MATTEEQTLTYTAAPTRRVTAETGIEYAYRDLGESDVPLVLLQHFRGNLDNWDPALVDALAAQRRVIAFDNVGVAATTGATPNTIDAWRRFSGVGSAFSAEAAHSHGSA